MKKKLLLHVMYVFILFSLFTFGERLLKSPDNLVELSLNKKTVSSTEQVILTVYNYGFKVAICDPSYSIYKEFTNGTMIKIEFPDSVAYHPINYNIMPVIGKYSEIVYIEHLESGNYLLLKEIKVDKITYTKNIFFAIK